MTTVMRAESPTDIAAVRGLMHEFNRWVMAEIAGSGNPSIRRVRGRTGRPAGPLRPALGLPGAGPR